MLYFFRFQTWYSMWILAHFLNYTTSKITCRQIVLLGKYVCTQMASLSVYALPFVFWLSLPGAVSAPRHGDQTACGSPPAIFNGRAAHGCTLAASQHCLVTHDAHHICWILLGQVNSKKYPGCSAMLLHRLSVSQGTCRRATSDPKPLELLWKWHTLICTVMLGRIRRVCALLGVVTNHTSQC